MCVQGPVFQGRDTGCGGSKLGDQWGHESLQRGERRPWWVSPGTKVGNPGLPAVLGFKTTLPAQGVWVYSLGELRSSRTV